MTFNKVTSKRCYADTKIVFNLPQLLAFKNINMSATSSQTDPYLVGAIVEETYLP